MIDANSAGYCGKKLRVALRDSNGELACGKVPISARVDPEENGSMVPVDIRYEDDGRALLSFQTMVAGEHRLIIKVKNKQLASSSVTPLQPGTKP